MKKWKYNEKYINSIEDCPKESIGFVYKITNKENGSYYIGSKKLFFKKTKKISKKKANEIYKGRGRKKTKETIITESDFLEYLSSSKKVQEMIAEQGLENFRFDILKFCSSYTEMMMEETFLILQSFLNKEEKILNDWLSIKIRKPK